MLTTVIDKKRVIKGYDKLDKPLRDKIDLLRSGYPENYLIFNDQTGQKVTAIPFETEDAYYLIRVEPPNQSKSRKSEIEGDDEDNDDVVAFQEDNFDSDYQEDNYELDDEMNDDY